MRRRNFFCTAYCVFHSDIFRTVYTFLKIRCILAYIVYLPHKFGYIRPKFIRIFTT